MFTLAVSFTNLGPYHLARLRALAGHLARSGGRLIAYETAGTQGLYPWITPRDAEPFERTTLFPRAVLEDLAPGACRTAMREALERDRPDVLAAAGYVRPECMEILRWAKAERRPTVLMSESQERDHPRVWWKEAVKRRRVRRFSAALVGGPRHRDYLVSLGMPAERISLGYNAVDGVRYAAAAAAARSSGEGRGGLPEAPYFLAVGRFAPEKNWPRLVRAFAKYRSTVAGPTPWDLVVCGDGPAAAEVERAVAESGCPDVIHRPGFLQADQLARWYAHASAFVLPSLSEPWGLVVNEAAACGLPLLVSRDAGCVETFVPAGAETTGCRFDPLDVAGMTGALVRVAGLPETERDRLGRRAAAVEKEWGPERFASGVAEAAQIAMLVERMREARMGVSVGRGGGPLSKTGASS